MAKKKKPKKASKKKTNKGGTKVKDQVGSAPWKKRETLKLAGQICNLEKKAKIKSFEVTDAADTLKTKKAAFADLINEMRKKAATIDQLENGNYQMGLDFNEQTQKGNGKPDPKVKEPTKAQIQAEKKKMKALAKRHANDFDLSDIYELTIAHINKRGKKNNPITKGSLALAVLGSQKQVETDRAQVWLDMLEAKSLVLRDITDNKKYFWVRPDKKSGGKS